MQIKKHKTQTQNWLGPTGLKIEDILLPRAFAFLSKCFKAVFRSFIICIITHGCGFLMLQFGG